MKTEIEWTDKDRDSLLKKVQRHRFCLVVWKEEDQADDYRFILEWNPRKKMYRDYFKIRHGQAERGYFRWQDLENIGSGLVVKKYFDTLEEVKEHLFPYMI